MAAASTLNVMTLGPQQKTMTTLMQPASNNAGCVIVSAPQSQPGHLSSPLQTASKVMLQQKRSLAPADARAAVMSPAAAAAAAAANSDMLRCKRRINFSHNAHLTYAPGHQPASVARRNARERNRVKQVNNGFATLRSRIPLSVAAALSSSSASASPNPSGGRGASKKLSKVETLRMAVEYIRSLQQLLEDHATETASTASTASSSASSTTPEPSGAMLSAAPGSDTGYYSSSPESGVTMLTGAHFSAPAAAGAPAALAGSQPQHGQHAQHPLLAPPAAAMPLAGAQLSPPCSEASSSPTPSYASEGSGSAGSAYAPPSVYQPDTYENYEPMSPEDEELLDVISWWQQSQ